jgi:ABC-type sulfate transport system permease subunit
MIERMRSNPRIVIAVAAGAVLLLAWIAWAIHVTSTDGAAAGLGVVIAWPAMLAALLLVSLPFIGGYLLVKRLSENSGSTAEDEDDSESEAKAAEG